MPDGHKNARSLIETEQVKVNTYKNLGDKVKQGLYDWLYDTDN